MCCVSGACFFMNAETYSLYGGMLLISMPRSNIVEPLGSANQLIRHTWAPPRQVSAYASGIEAATRITAAMTRRPGMTRANAAAGAWLLRPNPASLNQQ